MESSVKYKPLFSRVIIEREVKEKTAGGIIVPNAHKYATCVGTIVALGDTAGLNEDGTKLLNVGDKVIHGVHAGAWLDAKYGSEDGSLYICQDEDILAIIKE